MKPISNSRWGIARFWWIPLLTGLFCLGFGIWCLFSPSTSLPVFAYLFAAGFCVAGIFNMIYAVLASPVMSNWGWALALGLLEIIGGIWMFTLPEAALVSTFIFIVGVLILVAAINSIVEAFMLSSFSGMWLVWTVLMLICTIIFAILFLSSPIGGGIAVWLWLGISLIAFGVYRISLAFMIKSLSRDTGGIL